jgi:hypothetical protein
MNEKVEHDSSILHRHKDSRFSIEQGTNMAGGRKQLPLKLHVVWCDKAESREPLKARGLIESRLGAWLY